MSDLSMEQIEHRLTADAARRAQYRVYRQALGPRLLLTPRQSAILGVTPERRGVPLSHLILDAKVHRLSVMGVSAEDTSVAERCERLLSANRFSRSQKWIWRRAVRDGDSYSLVTWDESSLLARWTVRDAFDGSVGAHVLYDPLTGEPQVGLNQVRSGDWLCRDVYYPDRVEKWQRRWDAGDGVKWQERRDREGEAWPLPLRGADGEPLGIPLLHYRNDDDGSEYGESDLLPMLGLQADLSDTVIDLRAVNRASGWPLRYITGIRISQLTNAQGQPIISPVTNEPIATDPKMYLEPGAFLDFSSKDVDLGQLDAADPSGHIGTVDKLIFLISIVTGLPMHHFGGQWPSGEAQTRSEDRWNAGILDTQEDFGPVLLDQMRYSLRMEQTYGTGEGVADGVELEVGWRPPQPPSEEVQMERQRTQAARLTGLLGAGAMSRETAVRELHPDWDDKAVRAELDRIEQHQIESRAGSLFG